MASPRESRMVGSWQRQEQRMDFRGQSERAVPQYVRRSRHFVTKGQRMVVRNERTQKRQAGWHRRNFPCPSRMQGTGFFVPNFREENAVWKSLTKFI